jgi:hypothetical protein
MDDSPDLDFHWWTFVSMTYHLGPHFSARTWPIPSISMSLTILFELFPTLTPQGSDSHPFSLKKLATGLSALPVSERMNYFLVLLSFWNQPSLPQRVSDQMMSAESRIS